MNTSTVVFGGTFDPVHFGHLRTANELAEVMGYEQVTLMPCGQAYHKATDQASAEQRWQMLALACAAEHNHEWSRLRLDDRELNRSGPTYTVQTLTDLRAELGPDAHLSWVVGQDAAAGITRWHHWQTLFELANLIVVARPQEDWPASMSQWPAQFMDDANLFKSRPCGAVYQVCLTPQAISSSLVRQKIKDRQSIDDLVPAPVVNWIEATGLYRQR